MGGLITFADARSLPEGASPRTFDTDFSVGSVYTRPGLVSAFSFASTLQITAYSLGSGGLATFTYSGTEPLVNEGFTLGGFTGPLTVLNGQVVYVENVTMTTFTAFVNGPLGNYSGLTAYAVSINGLFIGPNIGSIATGPSWNNPSNISSPTAYATTTSGMTSSSGPTAPTAASQTASSFDPWVNPSNIFATGSAYATVITGGISQTILANGINGISIPSDATVTGITVTINAACAAPSGSNQFVLQLATNGYPVGTPVTFAVGSTVATYVKGSSLYQWGTTFTPSTVNGSALGVLVYVDRPQGGTATFSANSLTVTVYYTTAATSRALIDQGFSFAVSPTNGISGFGVSFKAFTSQASSVTLQLLQNGVPEGNPKTVALTTMPTVYSLGGPSDPWGYVWSAANVNAVTFGVQVISSGVGVTSVGDLDITSYITPALENFNWVGSYEQNNGDLTTLALDAAGNIWQENVLSNPGVLSLSLSGILPGSFGNGATIDNSEFVMFSDLTVGTDRPRQLDSDGNWYPVTQVGPGVSPNFAAATGSIQGNLTLTSFSQSGQVVTFTFNAVTTPPATGSLYSLNISSAAGSFLNGQVVEVLSGSTITTFTAVVTGGVNPTSTTAITGLAIPSFVYGIASITQYPAYAGLQEPVPLEWSASATSISPGTTITFYYQDDTTGGPDENLLKAFNSGNGAWVYITGAPTIIPCNGVWQVTAMGNSRPPGASDGHWYFSFTFTSSGNVSGSSYAGVTYRQTVATLTLSTPVPSLSAGTQFTITNATPTGWNNTWTILEAVNSGQFTITFTESDGTNATYGWQFASDTNSNPPVVNGIVTITGATNNAGYNGTFAISSVTGNTFTIDNLNLPASTQTPEGAAQAVMFGTVFLFDPGQTYVGTNTDVIYGNDTGTGQIQIIGTSIIPIGAGTRQGMCFFITESGNWTPASPPVTFTVASDANVLNVTKIPIGPPNVVGRGIAITEAGANGVPGANFYVITEPVTSTVGTTTTTYTSTIINDNTSQSASFSFTDAVLLNSQEVDIPGFNLFNLIEIGSSAWCVPYSSRMFYGMQLNKVQNFNNLTFDGGYVITNQPAGWSLYLTANELQLISSPVTGDALYISNTTGAIQPVMGTIAQTAFQDIFNVAIIKSNTPYSVRVACSCPSGVRLGTLVIDLVSLSGGNFGTVYGSFSVPFASMGSTVSVFTGNLLNLGVFPGVVPSTMQLRVRVINMGVGADVLIDRIEVFPTLFPYLKTEVYGSYINKPEAVDASGDGGIIDTSTENAQTCFGGVVMRDQLYLLKSSSMYSTRDNPNSEPGGWSLTEVSNRVGTCGVNAFDSGEEWIVTACRNGLYGFDGGKPEPLNLETLQIWNQINWNAGNSICVRNDTENRRILVAVPLPTGTNPDTGVATGTVTWLPFEPYNPTPTTPNVILVLNYQAIGSFQDLMVDQGVHATMFGSLANPDMRRKQSIWRIPTPYMGLITRANLLDMELFVCNGIGSSKIYEFDPDQLSDDGVAIYGLYTTYGHVNAVKAATLPIFGMHEKRYSVLQANLAGAGTCSVRLIPNDLFARYPYSVPGGIALNNPANTDYFRPLNCKAQRLFLEFSTNAVGSWFELCKTLLTGKADPWSSLNPTGGGGVGITNAQS